MFYLGILVTIIVYQGEETTFLNCKLLWLTWNFISSMKTILTNIKYVFWFFVYISNIFFVGLDNVYTPSFLGFSVYISNTTNKEDGVLCFRDTKYSGFTIPNPVNITCPHHGRYVIYYNNRTHRPYPGGYSAFVWTALCEVEVYGNM